MKSKEKSKLPHLLHLSFQKLADIFDLELKYQQKARSHNMETGLSCEAFFREQLERYIPTNYSVTNGSIIDKEGYTSGDCDVVIYDSKYAPMFWLPSGVSDRRKFIAFETTYAVIEVKENLTKKSLEDACKKVTSYKQLIRYDGGIPVDPLVHLFSQEPIRRVNPTFAIIFCYSATGYGNLKEEKHFKKLLDDFKRINQQVEIPYRVNGLFINKKGFIKWWGPPDYAYQRDHVDLPDFIPYWFPEFSPDSPFPNFHRDENTLFEMYHFLWSALQRINLVAPNLSDYDALIETVASQLKKTKRRPPMSPKVNKK